MPSVSIQILAKRNTRPKEALYQLVLPIYPLWRFSFSRKECELAELRLDGLYKKEVVVSNLH